MKIGFIGLGTMGRGMVENLLKDDHVVYGYNRTRARAEEIKHRNFHIAATPGEAAKNGDVIITAVSNDAALNDVLFTDDGVFSFLGSGKILIDCGTTSLEFTQKIADECRKAGAEFLDAPMTGSKPAADTGNILFMVGGDKETLDRVVPVLGSMGKKIVHCGPAGYGQKAKIALNLAQALVLQGYLEGIVLGLRNGVPIEAMREIFDNSGARNALSSSKMQSIEKRDFTPMFKLALMNKDIKLAESEMEKLGINLPLTKELAKIFERAMKKGLSDEDFSAVAKLLEEDSGVKIGK